MKGLGIGMIAPIPPPSDFGWYCRLRKSDKSNRDEGERKGKEDEAQQKIATTRRVMWDAGESRLDGPLANR